MRTIISIILIFSTIQAFAQLENPKIRSGNKLNQQKKYSLSEASFQKAKEINPNSNIASFNYANAQYKQKNNKSALNNYQNLSKNVKGKDTLASIYYNIGNTFVKMAEDTLKSKSLQGGIKYLELALDAYKSSIKLNPSDKKAKFNYLIAKQLLDKLKKQQQNQQNKNQNKQNQNKQNQNKQNQDKQNQDKQNQDKQNNNGNQGQKDTDKDGIPDNVEKQDNNHQNQAKPQDTDNDQAPDYNDVDSDNDGIPDKVEAGKNPNQPKDTDKDGIPDYRDTDSNNDGIPDKEEAMKQYAIPLKDINRLLKAVQKGDQKTYIKAKSNLQKNVKSKTKNW